MDPILEPKVDANFFLDGRWSVLDGLEKMSARLNYMPRVSSQNIEYGVFVQEVEGG